MQFIIKLDFAFVFFHISLLAHLSQRLNVSYCDHWMSVCFVRHAKSIITSKVVDWIDSLHPSQQPWSCQDGQFT